MSEDDASSEYRARPGFRGAVRARSAAAGLPALSGLPARCRRRLSLIVWRGASDGGPVAAFQFRVKDVDQHEAARLAEPLQRLCADRDVAFIVNDGATSPSDSAPTACISVRATATPARPGPCSAPARRSALPATTAAISPWRRARRAPTMSRSAPSSRPRPRRRHYRPDPSILSWWTTLFEIPCVAIGGITLGNGRRAGRGGRRFPGGLRRRLELSRRPGRGREGLSAAHRTPESFQLSLKRRHSSESWNLFSFQRQQEARFQLALE